MLTEIQSTHLSLAKSAILNKLKKSKAPLLEGDEGSPDAKKGEGLGGGKGEPQSCFVTLKKNGELRGCIGSIIPTQSLEQDIIHNTQAAAFEDPRFSPLTEEELENNEFSLGITILSPIEEKQFRDIAHLYAFLGEEQCGLIIKADHRQATFLPSVREELPEAEIFVRHLLWKTGIAPKELESNFNNFEFSIYYGEEFKNQWKNITQVSAHKSKTLETSP